MLTIAIASIKKVMSFREPELARRSSAYLVDLDPQASEGTNQIRTLHRTTAGYAHLADDHLVETAERIGRLIAEAMAGRRVSY